ncbi:MAG: hypothetical protein V3W41_14585 [Planctomycetota bacterium]
MGVAFDRDMVPIRFGLANDSKRLNENVKSSDLIGVCPVVITQWHIGRTLGVFTAVECKRLDWRWHATKRETAQQRFHNIVRAAGGYAGFARSAREFRDIITPNAVSVG